MRDFLRWLLDLWQRSTRTLDWPLCAALAALMGFGLAVLYSAGGPTGGAALVKAQGARFVVGLVAMWALSRIPVPRLRGWSPLVYVLSLLPLLAVLVVGTGRHGRHWLNLGVFYLQPSELLKITLPMMVAWYLHHRPLPPRLGTVLGTAVLVAVPTGLILLQPDFGTAMLIAASGGFALVLAGLPWWWIISAGGAGALLAGLALFAPIEWFGLVLRPYQLDRIRTFRDPENDPLGAGWNIIQSKIAIGSGGLTGKGWGEGSQSHLNFIPEQTTDFIFAVLSEEWGFVGAVALLVLYGLLFFRLARMALECNRLEDRLIIVGVLAMIAFQVMVNIGVTVGMAPVTGLTLPLFSAGGTSLLFVYLSLGLAALVHRDRYRDL